MTKRQSPLLDTRVIYCGDNLDQLPKLPDGCIDLIYIDPPFNSNRNYEVFWGETKEKRAFEDRHASTQAYIDFMRPRCVELARVLKPTGSFYYHCDWHASHYVKVMLDQILGESSFVNEIIWYYKTGGMSKRWFGRKHDTIFFYSKGNDYTFNMQKEKSFLAHKYGFSNIKVLEDTCPHAHTDSRNHLAYFTEVGMRDVWDIPALRGNQPEMLGYPTQKPLALLERIINASSNENDIVLDSFCGCGTALVAAEKLGRQWIGIDVSPTACRVMANRLHKVCRLREGEDSWRVGKGFVVQDLPWTEAQLRKIPPFEFENWAVIALGGVPNKTKVGDMGIDGRIFPTHTLPEKPHEAKPGYLAFDFMDDWYPIQVKQKDKAGRPDIDAFEAAMMRADRPKGFFVSFDFSGDAIREIHRFFKQSGKVIIALTVREILDEQIAMKLA